MPKEEKGWFEDQFGLWIHTPGGSTWIPVHLKYHLEEENYKNGRYI